VEVREPPVSYSEYRDLPDDAPRYEIIGGVGYLTPSPGGRHQIVSANLQYRFYQFVQAHRLGRVFVAPFDVVLSERDVVQPDLLFISGGRWEIVRERGVFGVPDLIVEIVSPSDPNRDRQGKLALYRQYGVREYWIVDLPNRAVDLWLSRETALDTRRVTAKDDCLESAIMPGFTIRPDEIFEGVDQLSEG